MIQFRLIGNTSLWWLYYHSRDWIVTDGEFNSGRGSIVVQYKNERKIGFLRLAQIARTTTTTGKT